MTKKALLIVDLQNDYFSGGKMELVGIDQAAQNAERLLDHFRKKDELIFHIQHYSTRPNATFFLPQTNGVLINDTVRPLADEQIIKKNYPNSFRNTNLEKLLHDNNIGELVICGAMSHMCIDATTRAAFDLEFNCTVIQDACATRDIVFNNEKIPAAKVHSSFMAALASVYAKILSTDEFLGGNDRR